MQKFTILILEDEPFIAEELREIAEENGYKVILAHTSEEALSAISTQKIHLALLDIKLEGETIDGIDIAKVIREKQNIPILFLTAYANDATIEERAKAIHYASFLEKGTFDLSEQLDEKLEESISQLNKQKVNSDREEFEKMEFRSDGNIIINTHVHVKDLEKGKRVWKRRRVVLHIDAISYITKNGDKTKIVTDRGIFEISTALTKIKPQIEKFLPAEESNKLCLAHKSSIVNPNKVVAYDKIGGVNYVYFNIEDSEEEGVPVKELFIQYLETSIGVRIKAKPKSGGN